MIINPNIYLSFLSCLIVFFVSVRVFDMIHSTLCKQLFFMVSLILALLSFSIPAAYLSDSIGANPVYAQFRAAPYAELIIVLSTPLIAGVCSSLIKRQNHTTIKAIVTIICGLLICLLYTSIPFIKPLLRPLPQHAIGHQWFGEIALQTTPSTCGPASLATIFKIYGHTDTEANIAKQAFSSATGTENWYLARYAQKQGYSYSFLHEPELSRVIRPSIIGVKLGRAGHFITLLEHKNGLYTIADSLDGIHHLTLNEFKQKYVYNGFVLHISKTK